MRDVTVRGEGARGARTIRVLVVDWSALFRSGMRRAIEAEPDLEVAGEAGDLQQAGEAVAAERPDVIVAGAITGDLASWRAVTAAWASSAGAGSIAAPGLTGAPGTIGASGAGLAGGAGGRCALVAVVDIDGDSREALDTIVDAFGAGALGCLDRSVGPEDLVHAVRAASHGRCFASSRVVRLLIDGLVRLREVASGFEEAVVHAMESPPGQVSCTAAGGPRHRLTARESEVLALVARGKSNREIAGMLSISEKTVKNHVSNLLRKLGADRRTQAAIWAISQGLSGSQGAGSATKVLAKDEPSDR